ncbi:unnamed protein product [Polarella glacialis]|uniref:Protein kinase domain-containing protein n=1 Tax=Polarella glacialis TaxID=89957 RepID=A0A813JZV3_POLGL|nr:unnamed protein product [Polarella glacialis]
MLSSLPPGSVPADGITTSLWLHPIHQADQATSNNDNKNNNTNHNNNKNNNSSSSSPMPWRVDMASCKEGNSWKDTLEILAQCAALGELPGTTDENSLTNSSNNSNNNNQSNNNSNNSNNNSNDNSSAASSTRNETRASWHSQLAKPAGHYVGISQADLSVVVSQQVSHSIPLLFADIVAVAVDAAEDNYNNKNNNNNNNRSSQQIDQKEHFGAKYILAVAPRPKETPRDADSEEPEALREVWFLCFGGGVEQSTDLQRLLFVLGRRGAIRGDLHECYHVSRKALGTGGCASVHLGQLRQKVASAASGADVLHESEPDFLAVQHTAVKLLKTNPIGSGEEDVRKEVGMLAQTRGHPNITALIGVFCFEADNSDDFHDGEEYGSQKLHWGIVMELCPCGDLHDFLTTHGPLHENACLETWFCL